MNILRNKPSPLQRNLPNDYPIKRFNTLTDDNNFMRRAIGGNYRQQQALNQHRLVTTKD
jgi:hypothetical protein